MAKQFKVGIAADGDVSLTGKLFVNASAGDEGGEIFLNKPVTNTSISGGVNIDVYQNKLRIWEDSGTNRGVYIDMTAAGAGVGTNLLGTATDTNYYPSAIVFNAGTTAGPTLDLTMSGSGAPDLTAVAIPSASGTASGVVTTGSQTFAGTKTFSSTISGSITGNAGTVTNGVYTTDTGTVTNTMLAGSIANAKLANSSVLLGSQTLTLGAAATTALSGLTGVSSTTFTSTATTGTAPFTVASTTMVTNLNADLLEGYSPVTTNTVNSIVLRDASGNFSAGAITGTSFNSITGLSSTTPGANGTAAVGTATTAARADHVHPTTGLGLTASGLNQFAATTSAQLAGVISDETGSGALVFANSPTLVSPILGVATGTSFNSITGLSSTTPAADGTAAVGTATTAARADHVHPPTMGYIGITQTTYASGGLTAVVGLNSILGDAVGTAMFFRSQGDMLSGTPTGSITVNSGNATNAASGAISIFSGTTTGSNASGSVLLNVGTSGGTVGSIGIGNATISNTVAPSAINIGPSANTTLPINIGGTPTIAGSLTLRLGGVGTAATAPLYFNSGSGSTNILTTPVSGAVEYDGTVFYKTSNTNPGRALDVQNYYYLSNSTYSIAMDSAALPYSILGASGRGITVPAGTTYDYECMFALTGTFIVTSQTPTITITGNTVTGSPVVAHQTIFETGNNTTGFTTAITLGTTRITAGQALTALTTGQRFYIVKMRGTIRVTGTGTAEIFPSIRPNSGSADNGWAFQSGTMFKLTPIGNGTVETVGTWA